MLEHAEISIDKIEKIKESTLISKSDKKTEQLNDAKKLIIDYWKPEDLPTDLIRLSTSVCLLLKQVNIDSARLRKLLDNESHRGRGVKTLNLSPYFIIMQTIINQDPQKFNKFLANRKFKNKIVIPSELSINGISLNKNKIIRI